MSKPSPATMCPCRSIRAGAGLILVLAIVNVEVPMYLEFHPAPATNDVVPETPKQIIVSLEAAVIMFPVVAVTPFPFVYATALSMGFDAADRPVYSMITKLGKKWHLLIR